MNGLNVRGNADDLPPLVCICGGSATGKTHFANGLVRQLESLGLTALPLHCDNYYRSRYKPDPIAGFDTINAIDTEALLADLQAARKRTLTRLRRYDMASRVVDYKPIDESCLSAGYDLIVVEGAYGPQAILPRILIDVVVMFVSVGVLRSLCSTKRFGKCFLGNAASSFHYDSRPMLWCVILLKVAVRFWRGSPVTANNESGGFDYGLVHDQHRRW